MSDGERFRFFYKGKAYLIPKDYIDDEHPGGGDEIWPWVNKDMTDAFDDADHSLDALEMLEEFLDEDYDPEEAAAPVECGEESYKEEGEGSSARPAADANDYHGDNTGVPQVEATKDEVARTNAVTEGKAAPAAAPAATTTTNAAEKPVNGKCPFKKPEGSKQHKSAVPAAVSAVAAVVAVAAVAIAVVRVVKRH